MALFKLVRLTFWAIGLMVGAGIYGTISEIVRISGAWAPAMFAGATVVMFLNGIALAGTVRHHPHAGSILTIVRESLHPWAAFLFELLRLTEGFAALCVTSKLSAKFAVGLAQGAGVETPVVVEVAMLMAVAFVVHRGLESAMDLGNLGTLVEVGGLVLVIAAGVVTTPAAPPPVAATEDIVPGPGVRDAAVSISIVLFAFGGVQGIVDVAGEVPPGEKWILPWAVVASIAATGLLYTAVCSAALSMVGVEGLARQGAVSPLGMVLERVGFPIGTEKALTLVSLVSVGNTCAGIFTFVSQIALSLGNHAFGGARPSVIYALMVVGAVALGQVLDVFSLAERIGVMLLLTFVVVDLAFLLAGARTLFERALGSLALVLSCALVLADRFA